jgi:hypothetical protein
MAIVQSILDYSRKLAASFGSLVTRVVTIVSDKNSGDGYHTTKFTGSEGVYLLPHHVKEIERLQKQHYFMNSSTGGVLLATPNVQGNAPLRILDAGCADGM